MFYKINTDGDWWKDGLEFNFVVEYNNCFISVVLIFNLVARQQIETVQILFESDQESYSLPLETCVMMQEVF